MTSIIRLITVKYNTSLCLVPRFNRRDRDATSYERRVESLETQVAELQAKLSEADAPRKRLEKENAVGFFLGHHSSFIFLIVN